MLEKDRSGRLKENQYFIPRAAHCLHRERLRTIAVRRQFRPKEL